jgi:sugar phosphate isomerase/epimerase
MNDGASKSWPLCYETNNYSPRLADFFADRNILYPPLSAQLQAAADNHYTLVGMDMGSIGNYLEAGHDPAQLRAELNRLDLRCLEVAEISITDDIDAALFVIETLLPVAEAVGAQFIQGSIFGDLAGAAAAAARAVEARLAASGIGLALEFLPFSPLDSIAATRDFIRAARLKNSKIVLDTWHFFLGRDQWGELDALPVGDIAYVQFNDHAALRSDDLLFETVNYRLLPGAGGFDLARFSALLQAKGYRGAISVEVLSAEMRAWRPQDFAAAEYRAARAFWP